MVRRTRRFHRSLRPPGARRDRRDALQEAPREFHRRRHRSRLAKTCRSLFPTVVADRLARLFAAVVNAHPEARSPVREIAGRTYEITIPTRHGPIAATVSQPETMAPTRGVCQRSQRQIHHLASRTGRPVVDFRSPRQCHCSRYQYVLAPRATVRQRRSTNLDMLRSASASERTRTAPDASAARRRRHPVAGASRMALENGGPTIAFRCCVSRVRPRRGGSINGRRTRLEGRPEALDG